MTTIRITIHLDENERSALQAMACSDMRPLKDQARYVIREAAQRRGLLPTTQHERALTTSEPATQQHAG
jgi:hypothetical protein